MPAKKIKRPIVFLLDPSLFSPIYDSHLLTALGSISNKTQVHFFSRKPRFKESLSFESHRNGNASELKLHFWFYPLSEKLRKLSVPLANCLKALEHFLSLCLILIFGLKVRPTTVHFQWIILPVVDAIFVRAFKLLGIRTVLTLHDTVPFQGSPTSRIQNWHYFGTVSLFDKIVTTTPFAKEKLLPQLKSCKSDTIDQKIQFIPIGPLGLKQSNYFDADLSPSETFLLDSLEKREVPYI
jgi:hypothetical protein